MLWSELKRGYVTDHDGGRAKVSTDKVGRGWCIPGRGKKEPVPRFKGQDSKAGTSRCEERAQTRATWLDKVSKGVCCREGPAMEA